MRYLTAMGSKARGNGLFFGKPWSERPWWSRWNDIIGVSVVGVILLIVIWDSVARWLGY
jgi:hypothetical protein